MPKVNGRDIFETKPWLNDDPQNIDQYSAMVDASAPTGTIEISANGEYDVSEYATADVQVEGGGGSSDFSTAEVTIVNNCAIGTVVVYCCIASESPIPFIPAKSEASIEVAASESETINVILYKGEADAYVESESSIAVSTSGSAEVDDGLVYVTGDCTITIADA